jgi:Ring finger domain
MNQYLMTSISVFNPTDQRISYFQVASDDIIGKTQHFILQSLGIPYEEVDRICYEPLFLIQRVEQVLTNMYDSWTEWKQNVHCQWNETIHLVIYKVDTNVFSYFSSEWRLRFDEYLNIMVPPSSIDTSTVTPSSSSLPSSSSSVPPLPTTTSQETMDTLANIMHQALQSMFPSNQPIIQNVDETISSLSSTALDTLISSLRQESEQIRQQSNALRSFTELLFQYPDAVQEVTEEDVEPYIDVPESTNENVQTNVRYFQFTIPLNELRNVILESQEERNVPHTLIVSIEQEEQEEQEDQEQEQVEEVQEQEQVPIHGYHHIINRRKRQTNLFTKKEMPDPVSQYITSLENKQRVIHSIPPPQQQPHSILHALLGVIPRNGQDDVKIILTKQEFRSLDTHVYKEEEEKDLICNVCLDGPKPKEFITTLPCQHRFHTECIFHWLRESSPNCPVCRGRVAKGRPVY